jgi:electron transfer flavoprotein beta subunit
MNIIVCVKQIQDPEIPASKFRLDAEGKYVVPPEGIPPVINPYDEQAVELALRLKDKHGGEIIILTIGNDSSLKTIRHALAMGADEGIILNDKAFQGSDSFSIAYILSKAIQKIKKFDLILCGRQAADWDEGLVGSIVAENLHLPLITLVESIDLAEGRSQVKRVILDGYQIFSVALPAVLTVSHEVGQPRLPSGWGIISASKKKIAVWDAKTIGFEPSQTGAEKSRKKLMKLFMPQKEKTCELIEEEKPEEAAEKLAIKLREAGIL